MTGRSRENYNKNYLKYVNSFDPPTQHFKTCGRAFLVGGLICCVGQFFRSMLELAGLTGDILSGTVSAMLIFLGVDPKTAREDACKMEHDISDETFEAMKRHQAQSLEKT